MKEGDIQSQILDYLTLLGHYPIRINTTGVFDPTTRRFRKLPNTTKGVSDIICMCVGGKVLFLEIKKPKTTTSVKTYQRKEQKDFQREIESRGGVYAVIRSLEDIKKLLED